MTSKIRACKEEAKRESLRQLVWSLLILAITMIVMGLIGLALGKDAVSTFWYFGFAHAQTDNNTMLPRTDFYYSSPVINFKTSNASTILPGQNETLTARCDDNNSLPFIGDWRLLNKTNCGLLTVLSSYPDVNMHAWNVTAMNIGSSPVSIEAVATCIRQNPH